MYLVVKVRDLPTDSVDLVELCKAIEKEHPIVEAAVVMRNNAYKTESDYYVMSVYTTKQDKRRLDGITESEKYGHSAD